MLLLITQYIKQGNIDAYALYTLYMYLVYCVHELLLVVYMYINIHGTIYTICTSQFMYSSILYNSCTVHTFQIFCIENVLMTVTTNSRCYLVLFAITPYTVARRDHSSLVGIHGVPFLPV